MKPHTDLLTIAIPVYERYTYFEECMNSVFAQTVQCKVIVIDNGSKTNQFKEFCEKHDVAYYRNPENLGMFVNWNKCFEFSDTEYVMILGDDDVIYENSVEEFVYTVEKYGDKEIDLYYTNFHFLFQDTGKVLDSKYFNDFHVPYGKIKDSVVFYEYAAKHGLGFPIIACIIKKSVFNGFYTEAHGSNDWLWVYKNLIDLKLYGNEKPMLKYRYHAANDSVQNFVLAPLFLTHAYIYSDIVKPHLKSFSLKLSNNYHTFKSIGKSYYILKQPGVKNPFLGNDLYAQYYRKTLKNKYFFKAIAFIYTLHTLKKNIFKSK